MFKLIKLLFLILVFVFVFQKISAIHHHKRISENLLIGTPYLWKNRILLINIDKYEKTREKIEQESQNMSTVMGMYEDSYLNATSRGQQYLMWSFLAVLIGTFTIIKSR